MSERRGQRGVERRATKARIASVLDSEWTELEGELDADYVQERTQGSEPWSILHGACALAGLDTDKVFAKCEAILDESNSEWVDLNYVVTHMRKQVGLHERH